MRISSAMTFTTFMACLFLLQACSSGPFVQDWDRNRLDDIANTGEAIFVSICFDRTDHSKEEVYALAREECGIRIEETENLIQFANAQETRFQTKAEGQGFEGSVERTKRISAMIASLQLVYTDNDKWDCPLMTPSRVEFECRYNPQADDSRTKRQTAPKQMPEADLPPELPEDLKP